MSHVPIWKQYGFSSEKEFRKRYPEYSRAKPKTTSKKSSRKSRVISKQEQTEMNRINNI